MSDPSHPGSPPDLGAASGQTEIEVDLAAFLPDGVEFAPPGDDEVAAAEPAEPDVAPGGDDVDLGLLTSIEHDLAAVDEALAALDAGTYGSCAVCREPLPADLLAADPVAQRCATHA